VDLDFSVADFVPSSLGNPPGALLSLSIIFTELALLARCQHLTQDKMSVYSRRSSSSSSGRSNTSNVTVRSTDLNVPRSKSLSVVTYLAGGDPRKHKNLRRQKITTEYDNGTYETTSQYFWVRDPYASTYYWNGEYDDYDDGSSVCSGSSRGSSRGSSSRRSKHGGHKGRAVPVQAMPPPPPQHHPMGGMPGPAPGMGPGMGMGMGMGMPPMGGGMPHPMMGGGGGMPGGPPPGVQVVDEMDDDDASSTHSGSSYMSGDSYDSYGSQAGMMPPAPPPNFGMPHMQPGPMYPGGAPPPPMMSGAAHPPPPMSHHGGRDNGGGGDLPEFFTL
jgi:hypothetical protein